MGNTVHLLVLANGSSAYGISYSASHADNLEYHFANEDSFDKFRGLDVKSVVFIGDVSKENADKFKSLIRD